MRDSVVNVESFIIQHCNQLGIKNYKIIPIDYLTDGQATTALLASKYWNPNNAILIYNIDTYVEPGQMTYSELKGDGFIPCFEGEGDHWSFVRLDVSGRVVEIKEKKRISQYSTLGAYYFKSCRLYEQLYTEYYNKGLNSLNGERFVAPLYDYLLSKGGSIFISNVPKEKVHVLGTPFELETFLNS